VRLPVAESEYKNGAFIKRLEYPLPSVKCSVDGIVIEERGVSEGRFEITNDGGGSLSGKITSNSRAVAFTPENFSGNKTIITYRADLKGLSSGEEINTHAIITTDGGELILPVTLRSVPAALITKETPVEPSHTLRNLGDFAAYAQRYTSSAAKLFIRNEFGDWLDNIKYGFIGMYAHLKNGTDVIRSLDDFLLFNGLKERSVLILPEPEISVSLPFNRKETVAGEINVIRNGWGYLAVDMRIFPETRWISLYKNKLTASDFDDAGGACVDFFVDASKVRGDYGFAKIIFESEGVPVGKVGVTAKATAAFAAYLSKQGFGYEDTGYIEVENNTGSEIYVDVAADSDYLKVGDRYRVRERAARIPFTVKAGAIAKITGGVINGRIRLGANIKTIGIKTIDLPFIIARMIE
jgi:hypothetical protein